LVKLGVASNLEGIGSEREPSAWFNRDALLRGISESGFPAICFIADEIQVPLLDTGAGEDQIVVFGRADREGRMVEGVIANWGSAVIKG
jgi:hypothetical protein